MKKSTVKHSEYMFAAVAWTGIALVVIGCGSKDNGASTADGGTDGQTSDAVSDSDGERRDTGEGDGAGYDGSGPDARMLDGAGYDGQVDGGDDGGVGPGAYTPFTARVSTQTINPRYGFGAQTRLVETVAWMETAGFDTVKIQADLPQGPDGYCLSALNPPAAAPVDLLQRDPSYIHVLESAFPTVIIWVNHVVNWSDGLSAGEEATEYANVYDVACHLLNTYGGSRKTFLIGHWEGDWLLKGGTPGDPPCGGDYTPGATRVQGMIDWLNTRGQAVADARVDCAATGVEVLSYAEVNCVIAAAESGKQRMTNLVLPHIDVDAISYSAYDVQGGDLATMRTRIATALNFIYQHASGAAKDYIFVGEYGFPYNESGWDTPARPQRAAAFIEAAAGWGARHVLWWQVYDNECDCGGSCGCGDWPVSCRGFWLVDTNQNEASVLEPFRRYNGGAHLFKNLYRVYLQRNPEPAAIDNYSAQYRTFDFSQLLNQVLDSAEHHNRLSDSEFVASLFEALVLRAPTGAEIATWSAVQRSAAFDGVMDSNEAQAAVSDGAFVDHLYHNMLGRAPSTGETNMMLTTLQTTPRSSVWRSFLTSSEFRLHQLDLRHIDMVGAPQIQRAFWFDF